MTDFENAAFSIFIVLLSRAILTFGVNFYIPISKVDENMERAQRRDAARKGRFFFRSQVYPPGEEHLQANESVMLPTPPSERATTADELEITSKHKGDCGRCTTHSAFKIVPSTDTPIEEEYEEMTMNEIINGKVSYCPCSQSRLTIVQGSQFPGLLGLVNRYVNTLDVEYIKKYRIRKYLNLIKQRADGV